VWFGNREGQELFLYSEVRNCPASWSAFLTTNREVLGSIPGCTMESFSLIEEDPHSDHGPG
jgi:hypothetical protein